MLITALVVFHFFVPFALLLVRAFKSRGAVLCGVAAAILFMRLLDIFWYTAPAFHPGSFNLHWMDIAAPIGLGGIWLAVFFSYLRGQPLLRLGGREAVEHG